MKTVYLFNCHIKKGIALVIILESILLNMNKLECHSWYNWKNTVHKVQRD